jgi:hypothetical protein
MPPAPYPDFRWFFRSLRALPVFAIAALVGGIIGGFSVFALDLALTTPLNHEVGAEVGKINGDKASESAAAAPAAGTSAPPVPQEAASNAPPGIAAPQPVPQSQAQTAPPIAVTPPLSPQQTTWPDALSREHESAPDIAATATSPPTAAAAAMSVPPPARSLQAPATQTARVPDTAAEPPAPASEPTAKTEIARKPVPTKRRVAIKQNVNPASDGGVASTGTGRPVYDSYGRSDEASSADARARYEYSSRRYGVRHQRAADNYDRSSDGDADQSDRSDSAMPPQPAPPPLLFGLFGGGDRYDDR